MRVFNIDRTCNSSPQGHDEQTCAMQGTPFLLRSDDRSPAKCWWQSVPAGEKMMIMIHSLQVDGFIRFILHKIFR